jgi:hypothetical protein
MTMGIRAFALYHSNNAAIMADKSNRRSVQGTRLKFLLPRIASFYAAVFTLLLTAQPGVAQTLGKAPTVTMASVAQVTAARGEQTMVTMNFRVPPGYHINSNTPKSEFLIPTALKMDLPTDIVFGKIEYPAGEDRTFPFSPDEKLSVYSGDFSITVAVHPLHTVTPGKYEMRGVLRYQACDNAACYPPKNLPVNFEVKVVKGKSGQSHANPAQSPHVHN